MKFATVVLTLAAIMAGSRADKADVNLAINKKLLKAISNSIDEDIMPCSDFYKYACGKWAEQHEDNKHKYTSTPTMVEHEANMELIRYMDNTPLADKPDFVKKAYTFYTSCTDEEAFDEVYYMSWMAEEENITWAMLSEEEEEEEEKDAVFDWVTELGVMRKYGMNGILIDEMMAEKEDDISQNIISLNKPAETAFVSLTWDNIESLIKSTLPLSNKTFAKLWPSIEEFEKLLVKLLDNDDEEGGKHYSVKELPTSWLHKYLGIAVHHTTWDATTEITVQNTPYLEALDALLNEYDAKFICQYLEVRFLWYLQEHFKRGSHVDCMADTRRSLPLAMHWIYEQLHPEIAEEVPKIELMFKNIINNMKQNMRSAKSGTIPAHFLHLLDKVQLKIGNLPREDTIPVLESYYANLTLGSDYYGNHLKLLEFTVRVDHLTTTNEINIDVNKFFVGTEGYDLGNDITPFYLRPSNVLIVPTSYLRPPFYHWGYADILKYSSLGANLVYHIYENIDLGGFSDADIWKIAEVGSLHSTYQTVFSNLRIGENLSAVDSKMKLHQIFFINAAQYYCDTNADTYEYNHLNFIVSHLPEFTEAFECKLGTFLEMFGHL